MDKLRFVRGSGLAAALLCFSPPGASAIVSVQETHQLEYFLSSQAPGIATVKLTSVAPAGTEGTGAFHAAWVMESAPLGNLKRGICARTPARERLVPPWLTGEIHRLRHEVPALPEHVRFTLRTSVLDDRSGTVLDWRAFEAEIPVGRGDAHGTLAANQALREVLGKVAAFCADPGMREIR